MRIGELLQEAGAITWRQLELAQKHQQQHGGRLGTNLIELGFVNEATLAAVLAQQHRLPAVSAGVLERVPADVIALMPRSLAEQCQSCPVRRDGERLFVAVSDPGDAGRMAELRRTLPSFEVRPMVAPEFAIGLALERYYGVQRPARPTMAPARNGSAAPSARGVVVISPAPGAPPDELSLADPFAPDAPGEEEPGLMAIEAPLIAEVLAEALQAPGVASAASVPAPAPASTTSPAPVLPPEGDRRITARLTLAQYAERLVAGSGESDLSDATMALLAQDFSRLVMIVHRGGRWQGWRGLGGGLSDEAVRRLDVPRDELPVLVRAVEDGVPRVGRGAELVGGLRFLIGEPGDDGILVLPVRCSGRPVGCFVAIGGGPRTEARFEEWLSVARKLDLMLQILVLRRHVLHGK